MIRAHLIFEDHLCPTNIARDAAQSSFTLQWSAINSLGRSTPESCLRFSKSYATGFHKAPVRFGYATVSVQSSRDAHGVCPICRFMAAEHS